MELSGQIAAGISLQLPSARRWAAQDGAIQAGTPSDGRSCRPVVCARQSNVRDQVGIGGDPRGDHGATCKIAGIAYTGSNPVPATMTLSCENVAAGPPIRPGSKVRFRSGFPPPDASRHRRHHLGVPRRRAEHPLNQPGQPGRRLGELVDVDPLGERAAVGVAQLGGDDAGRFLVGRHRRGQGMTQQVWMGGQPDAGGQPGEGAAGVVGVDRRAPLGAEHQVQLDRVGWLAGSTQRSPTVAGCPTARRSRSCSRR
jgi:hypothetical protein